MPVVGVLALQGDVREHCAALEKIGVEVREVRVPPAREGVDGLIFPGGESTAIAHLLNTSGLREGLASSIGDGLPVFGTCAGLILLSSKILDGRDDQWSFSALDVTVRRNGYGRQIASFETVVDINDLGEFPGVFIRAPKIESIGQTVSVLATHDHGDGEHPVLVRQANLWGCSFHPELTIDTRLHEAFVASL